MDNQNVKKLTVAYVPFKTFLNGIESLKQGVPSNINRTVFPSFSGLMISQVLGTFRFLGLITQDGTPTDELHKLVEDEPNRKALLKKIMVRSYEFLSKHDPAKMDLRSLQTAFSEYGVTGTTLKKAITFFLQLARYAELKLSPYLLQQTRNVSGPRKRRNATPRNGQMEEFEETQITVQNRSGSSRTINLNRGINLTLQTSADVFKMSPEDREFVLKLLDQIEDYEAQVKGQPEKVDF
jgi:hypothetical protein